MGSIQIESFLTEYFSSFTCNIDPRNAEDLQSLIARKIHNYMGWIENGTCFIYDGTNKEELTIRDLVDDMPFTYNAIEDYTGYLYQRSVTSKYLYNGIPLTIDNHWAIGGIYNIFEDLLSKKIKFYTFPVNLIFSNIGISYTLKVSLYYEGDLKLNVLVELNKGSNTESHSDSQPSTIRNYYTGKSGLTVDQFIADFDMSFARGSVIKYVVRAGKKNPDNEIEDLEKAIQYLKFELSRLKKDTKE